MEVITEQMPTYLIAYLRTVGPYGINNVRAMEELKKWAEINHLLNEDSIILGIAQDNPMTTKPENCRYDTCIVISTNYSFTDNFVNKGKIDGGKYAVFQINHTAEAVQKAWADIFPEISKQGYQIDETRQIIERYKAQMVKNHYCEICVPIY